MDIQKVTDNRRAYTGLPLLADEQKGMMDKHPERGGMFVLYNDGVKAECVITKESEGICELRNTAVMSSCQRKGYGERMIDLLLSHHTDRKTLLIGTGDAPSTPRFYHKCGFIESHCIKNFFTDNYDYPIFEDGEQLVDMVYLKRKR